MAYRSRTSTAARRGGSSRSGGGRSSNTGALVLAVVIVLGGIGAIVAVSASGKKKPNAPPPQTPQPTVAQTPKPPENRPPPPPPYPDLPASRVAEIKAEVRALKVDEAARRAQKLYDEALTAKNSGDEATWQTKLREAEAELGPIQDAWNEIEASMPSTKDYDEAEVANHYLGDEANSIRKATEVLSRISKQLRMR
jgi:hypothetical protein